MVNYVKHIHYIIILPKSKNLISKTQIIFISTEIKNFDMKILPKINKTINDRK